MCTRPHSRSRPSPWLLMAMHSILKLFLPLSRSMRLATTHGLDPPASLHSNPSSHRHSPPVPQPVQARDGPEAGRKGVRPSDGQAQQMVDGFPGKRAGHGQKRGTWGGGTAWWLFTVTRDIKPQCSTLSTLRGRQTFMTLRFEGAFRTATQRKQTLTPLTCSNVSHLLTTSTASGPTETSLLGQVLVWTVVGPSEVISRTILPSLPRAIFLLSPLCSERRKGRAKYSRYLRLCMGARVPPPLFLPSCLLPSESNETLPAL